MTDSSKIGATVYNAVDSTVDAARAEGARPAQRALVILGGITAGAAAGLVVAALPLITIPVAMSAGAVGGAWAGNDLTKADSAVSNMVRKAHPTFQKIKTLG